MASNDYLISVRAGKCEYANGHVVPRIDSGILYMTQNEEEDLTHLAWKKRNASSADEEDDLIIFPGDCELSQYKKPQPENGRILVLKFRSSNERRFYWLQTPSQKPDDLAFWSERDLKIVQRFNAVINGEDVDIEEDILMEELGALADSHGPASHDAIAATLNNPNSNAAGTRSLMDLLQSMQRGAATHQPEHDDDDNEISRAVRAASMREAMRGLAGSSEAQSRTVAPEFFISLADLLSPKDTCKLLYKPEILTPLLPRLLENLPPGLVPEGSSERETIQILDKVFRSAQLTQALGSLTGALREGALENIATNMRLDVTGQENAGTGGLVVAVHKEVKKELEREAEAGEGSSGGAGAAAGDGDEMDIDQ